MGFSKICKLQKLDTSDKAILESYGEDMQYFKLEKLIQEHNEKYLINTGNGKVVEVPKNSKIQIKIKDGDEYGILIQDLTTLSEHQVIGKTKDLIQYANLDKEASSTLSKIQMGVGFASVGQGIYENIIHQPKRYIPKKGVNAGKRTDVFKRTADGKLRYKFDIKKPQNIKFVSKAAQAHYQKGLKIKGVGKILGWGGIFLIPFKAYQRGEIVVKDGVDIMMGIVGLVPGWGWAISGIYFFLDIMEAFNPITTPISNPYKSNQDLLLRERDKTYVTPFYSEKEGHHQFESISERLTREFRERNEDKKRK